MPIADN